MVVVYTICNKYGLYYWNYKYIRDITFISMESMSMI